MEKKDLPYFAVLKVKISDRNWYKTNILEVENNEGNQFHIGDLITPVGGVNKGVSFKIKGFRYASSRTNVCAITEIHGPYGIGIDKIEHFIEKGTLLKKAKRLYPGGTKFVPCYRSVEVAETLTGKFTEEPGNLLNNLGYSLYIKEDGRWAKVIK